MDKNKLLNMVQNLSESNEEVKTGERVLLIDGLNLFFRNFAMLNMVNPDGVHIGGLGGFFRSLGALIRQTQPTSVYVVFDGAGSSNNRKNLLPEYKSGRNLQRITNWEVFGNLEEEDDAKIDQIVRIIQYLKTLPVKTISIDKVEADDIIAYLSRVVIKDEKDKVFIVSSDKDFLQLINDNVSVYRPMERAYYTSEVVMEKFNVLSSNFIIYKTLMGDSSDKISGVKGLGQKKIFKLFPELSERTITLSDILKISEDKYKENVIYSRIVMHFEELEKNYKVMDLANPFLDEKDKEYINKFVSLKELNYIPDQFISMYEKDKMGGMIRNIEFWVKDIFEQLT